MTVYFSAEAEAQTEEIAAWLGANWSQKVKTDFLALVSDKLELIAQMPELYRATTKRPDQSWPGRFVIVNGTRLN